MSPCDEIAQMIEPHVERLGAITGSMRAAEHVVAAGYRKPRPVVNVDELAALPRGTVLVSNWDTAMRAGLLTKERDGNVATRFGWLTCEEAFELFPGLHVIYTPKES